MVLSQVWKACISHTVTTWIQACPSGSWEHTSTAQKRIMPALFTSHSLRKGSLLVSTFPGLPIWVTSLMTERRSKQMLNKKHCSIFGWWIWYNLYKIQFKKLSGFVHLLAFHTLLHDHRDKIVSLCLRCMSSVTRLMTRRDCLLHVRISEDRYS